MQPEHLQEDLKQEVILILCELPEDKLIKLHENGAMQFYTVRIILNQIRSKTSPFAKKYRRVYQEFKDIEINDNIDIQERSMRELVEDIAMEEVDKLYWYNKGLVELYLTHGNYRAIQKETGIPFGSCYKTIKKSLNQIKKDILK